MNRETQSKLVSLETAFAFLKSIDFDPEKEYQHSFEIDPRSTPISAESLRSLLTLPFEVSLTERNGHLVLDMGGEHSVGSSDADYRKRRDQSRVSMHTHVFHTGHSPENIPSFSDIQVAGFANETTPLLLASPAGIIRYQKPSRNPLPNESYLDIKHLIIYYGRFHGINTLRLELPGKPLKKLENLTDTERLAFLRKFAEETGVIVSEASWEDTKGIKKLLALVNLEQK